MDLRNPQESEKHTHRPWHFTKHWPAVAVSTRLACITAETREIKQCIFFVTSWASNTFEIMRWWSRGVNVISLLLLKVCFFLSKDLSMFFHWISSSFSGIYVPTGHITKKRQVQALPDRHPNRPDAHPRRTENFRELGWDDDHFIIYYYVLLVSGWKPIWINVVIWFIVPPSTSGSSSYKLVLIDLHFAITTQQASVIGHPRETAKWTWTCLHQDESMDKESMTLLGKNTRQNCSRLIDTAVIGWFTY